jgi:hypothetical protein
MYDACFITNVRFVIDRTHMSKGDADHKKYFANVRFVS